MENLSELATIYPNVKILHFHVDIRNNRLDFKVEISGFLFFYSSFFTLLLFLFLFFFFPHDWQSDLLTQFELKDGPRYVPHYGLLLAEVAGLPSSVIETARSITSRITEKVIPIETWYKNIKLLSLNVSSLFKIFSLQ